MVKRITAILSVCLLVLVLLTACGGDSKPSPAPDAPTTPDITDYTEKIIAIDQAQYKFQGRTMAVEDGIIMDWTNSGLEFNAQCEGDVSLSVTTFGVQETYYTVIVDGGEPRRVKLNVSGEQVLPVAEGLERGYHTFQVYKQSENQHGRATVHAVTLSGEFREPPPPKDLFIEFYGDSITCGYGNLTSSNTPDGERSEYEDGYQSYASITARDLDADWSIVAESGWGLHKGWGTRTIPHIYEYTNFTRDRRAYYDFPRRADVIVVNLGTNDNSFNVARDDFAAKMEAFTVTLRERNPGIPVIWVSGMMGAPYESTMKAVLDEMGGAGAGYYYCMLPHNQSGGGWHPDLDSHYTAAGILTELISRIIQ